LEKAQHRKRVRRRTYENVQGIDKIEFYYGELIMKWIDYREKLGIGFNDDEKFIMLRNKILNKIKSILSNNEYSYDEYCDLCFEIGKRVSSHSMQDKLLEIFEAPKNSKELISIYIAFCNTYSNRNIDLGGMKFYNKAAVISFIKEALTSLNIPYEILKEDKDIFIIPKGAEELDKALVSEPLQWLKKYPQAHIAYIKALKEYGDSNADNASEIADKFRKSLETFFQEFFGGNKALENYKSEYGTFLKGKNIPSEISNNLQMLLDAYTKFNNNYAKHHDKTSLNVLEYIMYETGNIIRLIITLKDN